MGFLLGARRPPRAEVVRGACPPGRSVLCDIAELLKPGGPGGIVARRHYCSRTLRSRTTRRPGTVHRERMPRHLGQRQPWSSPKPRSEDHVGELVKSPGQKAGERRSVVERTA